MDAIQALGKLPAAELEELNKIVEQSGTDHDDGLPMDTAVGEALSVIIECYR